MQANEFIFGGRETVGVGGWGGGGVVGMFIQGDECALGKGERVGIFTRRERRGGGGSVVTLRCPKF